MHFTIYVASNAIEVHAIKVHAIRRRLITPKRGPSQLPVVQHAGPRARVVASAPRRRRGRGAPRRRARAPRPCRRRGSSPASRARRTTSPARAMPRRACGGGARPARAVARGAAGGEGEERRAEGPDVGGRRRAAAAAGGRLGREVGVRAGGDGRRRGPERVRRRKVGQDRAARSPCPPSPAAAADGGAAEKNVPRASRPRARPRPPPCSHLSASTSRRASPGTMSATASSLSAGASPARWPSMTSRSEPPSSSPEHERAARAGSRPWKGTHVRAGAGHGRAAASGMAALGGEDGPGRPGGRGARGA